MKKLILITIIILLLASGFFYFQFKPAKQVEFGLSFSPRHAEYLGFKWQNMFLDIVNDLNVKKLRLTTYWEDIEKEKDKFDFSEIDYMLNETDNRGIDVVLVVGLKQPRWPECHYPAWYKNFTSEEQEKELLDYIIETVEHLKQRSSVKVWQVENEPLFGFGPDCSKTDKELLETEIDLVKSLDQRPIMLTDSGELGRWLPVNKYNPDIFGITMYRVVHNPKLGYFKYPLPPIFFRIKAGVLKTFTKTENIVGAELQAEPWFAQDLYLTSLEDQKVLMNREIFAENIEYAKDVGFPDNYLWGVEWWYWLAKKHNDWSMWAYAKDLFAR